MELDELLGIGADDPLTQRARDLLESDRKLLTTLVARRRELGLTQREVARRMDVSQSAVARVESGGRDLHQSTIRRYAMAVEALIEHHVQPHVPAKERSARLLRELSGQMTSFDVAPDADPYSSQFRQGTWISHVKRRRQNA